MRMSTNEEVHRLCFKLLGNARSVPLGMSANVRDPHPTAFDGESLVVRVDFSKYASVYVAVNRSYFRAFV